MKRLLVILIISAFICGVTISQNLQSDVDTLAFVDYVKKNGQEPKDFMMEKLSNHKLVIYGEVHRRKASWDLLKSIIKDPSFSKRTGIVFLEMSSDSQEKMDKFFANEDMNKEIILDIFRDVQMPGWPDRGMYEFVIDLWNINRGLAKNEKINLVLVDIPRPYSSLKTKEEFDNHFKNLPIPNRDHQMADIIEKSMQCRTDERSGLFIVGMAHAFNARAAVGNSIWITAGSHLKECFSDKDVFIFSTHAAIMNNTGYMAGLTRNGIFDYAFKRNGNKPVAFNLAGSPFGKERFDLILELKSFEDVGSYENNFDGLIFLMPLKDEGPQYLLPELFTENFVQELRRRAIIFGNENWRQYGAKVKDITLDDIHKCFQKEAQDKYWNNLNEN